MANCDLSNEELAERVKNGSQDAELILWTNIQNLVRSQAWRYIRAYQLDADIDDLIQSGYFAMLKAAEAYDIEQGAKFSTFLTYYLKREFAKAAGITKKSDAMQYATSLDAPIGDDECDSSMIDFIQDTTAALAYLGVEYRDFLNYTRSVIKAALADLQPSHRIYITERYLHKKSADESATLAGFTSARSAATAMEPTFYKIRCGKYGKTLKACLEGFEDFRRYKPEQRFGFYR